MKEVGKHCVLVVWFFFFPSYQMVKELMRTVSAVNQNGLGKNILGVFPFVYLTARE